MCDASERCGGCGEAAVRGRAAPVCSQPRPCVKCGEGNAAVVVRIGDAFCRACFREYFVHKFRAMLGKNRVIFPGEKVLLALSGGMASSAMLRQVQEGLSRETAKRLRFVPGLVYIDEGAVCGQSRVQREQTLSRMESLLQETGFPYYLASLEQALELPGSILRRGPGGGSEPSPSYKAAVEGFIQQQRQEEASGDGGTSPTELSTQGGPTGDSHVRLPAAARTEELLRLFDAAETLTAKEELLQMLRSHLLLHTARTQGYTKVMTGESCTRVAIKLLTNLALGRGAFLAVDTGFVDNRHGDVTVVRPMRDYMAKEIAFYNHFFGVPTVITPPLHAKRREKTSIHRLMESFLLGLQVDFPSTISTVYRTGEKLSVAPAEASSELQRCLLCLCALDIAGEEELALEPTLVKEETGNGAESRAAFIPLLCYSCRLTFKEMGPPATLPPYVRSEAQHRSCRALMKQQIQEFLLEDDEEEPGGS
ncbi:cytoplasmic tRNA 2-thiolation protein 2 isoform X2 [Cyrtonyx montezumae]|uniref:cytoplasmic tRNA 2-thiolation protein 2 isoform X2 n=1 Tax=Cyrtonyx montezumae TaxID=9017 RepID=UPI0032DB173A